MNFSPLTSSILSSLISNKTKSEETNRIHDDLHITNSMTGICKYHKNKIHTNLNFKGSKFNKILETTRVDNNSNQIFYEFKNGKQYSLLLLWAFYNSNGGIKNIRAWEFNNKNN